MVISMTRRGWIRLLVFAVATFLTLTILLWQSRIETMKFHTTLQNEYADATAQLCDYISRLDTDLNKQLYTSTQSRATLLSSELLRDATGAKESLSRLPIYGSDSSGIYRFLSQVGNYSLSLSQKHSLTDEDRKTLKKLRDYCDNLTAKVEELALTQDFASWDNSLPDDIAKCVEKISQTVSDYPTLIYDGPFSDHIDRKNPAYLADKLTVDVEKAQKIASEILGTSSDKLKRMPDEQSLTPAYVFSYNNQNCAITKTAGALLYITSSRQIEGKKVDEQTAIESAKNFLEKKFNMPFRESYYVVSNGLCTVNFAYFDNDTIYYPDLVKVSVALDNGKVEEVEARGFIMNHKTRTKQTPKYSSADAKEVLNSSLNARATNLCVIDPNGTSESLCYEFYCTSGDDEILVYIDAQTLEERNMLIITRTDGGTLTR